MDIAGKEMVKDLAKPNVDGEGHWVKKMGKLPFGYLIVRITHFLDKSIEQHVFSEYCLHTVSGYSFYHAVTTAHSRCTEDKVVIKYLF
ncbi:hypothetical protein [Prevotella sp. S7 MS 2]|uniref:hypothetical protein n=1 Tax=Prevotella sp. S7 MS 2 TaxID=1287488 RepID=UPI0005135BB3|nr:hypothetical protein [Prevotella sp. S7 MS 2]KGI61013.1 hypothetical protein HMPREF0671_02535 [Prevotella sp. S7 MS 2]